MLRYSSGEDVELINLQGREEVLFDVYSQQIDRDVQAYEDKCAKNKANASGGKRTLANASDGSQDKGKDKDKDKDEDEEKEDPTVTSLPSDLKKKIDLNYKHSKRARMAVAQLLVDQITQDNLPPAEITVLYDYILDALEQGLTPEIIYDCARKSAWAGEFTMLTLYANGGKWKDIGEKEGY